MEMLGVSLAWEQVGSLVKRLAWGDWGRRKYLWCFDIVAIFMGLGGAKRWGGVEVLNSSYGVQAKKRERPIFMGGGDPSNHHDLLDYNKLDYLIVYILTQSIVTAMRNANLRKDQINHKSRLFCRAYERVHLVILHTIRYYHWNCFSNWFSEIPQMK